MPTMEPEKRKKKGGQPLRLGNATVHARTDLDTPFTQHARGLHLCCVNLFACCCSFPLHRYEL